MATENKPLQNFNLDTMSGIYPGSRTMTYQRLRLHRGDSTEKAWYQLQWYDDPRAAVLFEPPTPDQASTPLLTLQEPQQSEFSQSLHRELSRRGLKADACFSCRHWQPLRVHTDDGLPAGRCTWQGRETNVPDTVAIQSALSLACAHLDRLAEPPAPPTNNDTSIANPRVLKSAELDPDRLPFWPRLWHRLFHRNKPAPHWSDQLLERSGVGAGTEPCFVCQGRLANLGALAVASPEGDKQTLSVWRCRSCYTTYFNDWTDRWERLDNLETEERYYRIAPAEAFAALRIIHETEGGDHPGRRQERRAQREQILALVASKTPLSHQIRQGR